jgi:hypothetical protein
MNEIQTKSDNRHPVVTGLVGMGLALWLLLLVVVGSVVGLFLLGLIIPGFGLEVIRDCWFIVIATVLAVVLGAAFFTRGLSRLLGRRAWRGYLWTSLGVVSLTVLFYSAEAWRGKRAWAKLVRECQERGEKLDLAALTPADVPDEQNFAKTAVFAPLFDFENGPDGRRVWRDLASLQRLRSINLNLEWQAWHLFYQEGWMCQKTVDLKFWQRQFRKVKARKASGAAPGTTSETGEPAGDILDCLGAFTNELSEVCAASQRPYAQFSVQRTLGYFAEAEEEAILQNLGEVLVLRALAELALNESDAAFRDTQAALSMADYQRQQVSSLGFARFRAMFLNALQPLWEGLAKQRWSEAQLAAFQARLSGFNLLAAYAPSLRDSVLFHKDLLNQIMPITPIRSVALKDDAWVLPWLRLIYPIGWSYQNQTALYRLYQKRISAVDVDQQRVFFPHGTRGQLLASLDPLYATYVAPKIHEIFHDCLLSCALTQSAVNEAIIACALERYRLAQGQFPESLDRLLPRFAAHLPHDIMNGQPLAYRRIDGGGFVLYSVGWNLTDDEGRTEVNEGRRPPHASPERGDWVWEYPAR